MGGYSEGYRAGTAAGSPLDGLLDILKDDFARKRKERKDEDDATKALRGEVLKLGRETAAESQLQKEKAGIEAKQKKQETKFDLIKTVQEARVKGQEARKTERVKAEGKERPLTLSDLQRPAVNPLGVPVVKGPGGRPISGTEGEAIGGQFGQGELAEYFGYKPKGVVGEELTLEYPKTEKEGRYKPFQLTPEREQEFTQSIQNGLNALQSGEANPATGQPYTAQEIFRMLAVAFPGQENKLRTMFLSGKAAEVQLSLSDELFSQ